MIWTVLENAATPLDGFEPAWLPDDAFEYLKVSLRDGQVIVEPGPYSGAVLLANGDTLHITPRAGTAAFGRMLLVGEGLADALQKMGGLTKFGLTNDSGDWGVALARAFARHLLTIDALSPLPSRVRQRSRGEIAVGRVFALQTITSLHRREAKPVHYSRKARTLDNPEQRVLGRAARTIASDPALSPEERRASMSWAVKFGFAFTPADLIEVLTRVRRGHYFGPRSYYHPALLTANILLGVGGLGLSNAPNLLAESLVTNTSTVFEKYVRGLLGAALGKEGYVVRKGHEPTPTLFTDGSIAMTPDVVISSGKGTELVIDAKYKPSPDLSAGDCYQMYSYLNGIGTKTGAIVSAAPASVHASSTPLRTADGRVVYDIRLPLDGATETEEWFVSRVRGLLP